jgi:glycosyltransferase involved in cell wall biosynthesis
MYFSYVSHSGGVIDVARNVLAGLQIIIPCGYEVKEPSSRIRLGKIRTLMRFLADAWLGFRYWRSDVTLLFPNYFCLPILGARCRMVVVVHDIMFKHYPGYVGAAKRRILDWSYRLVTRYADGVVFISQDSEADFVRVYGKPRKFTTIYNPVVVSGGGSEVVRTVGPQGHPYVIANFHYYPHKNLEGLLKVFDALQLAWPGLKLVFTGNKPAQFDALIGGCDARTHVLHLGFLPKDQVMALIRDAAFFMSMSRFEGFNMSAAEAALLGKPLILSDLPVHRELFSDCARFVPLDRNLGDAADLVDFVRAFKPGVPAFAEAVKPEVAAGHYLEFLDEVSRR